MSEYTDTDRINWLQKDEREMWIHSDCCDSYWVISEWGNDGKELGRGSTFRKAIDNAIENEEIESF